MRVLFIDSREGGDYSLDLIFAGLVRRFGAENVLDWPSHAKHRAAAPIWNGYDGSSEAAYGAERRSLCYTDGYVGHRQFSLVELRNVVRSGAVDMVIVDERDESYLRYLELGAHLFPIPVVVIAGHDRFWNISPVHVNTMYPHLRAMFVDDWQQEYDALPFCHLINLSTNFDHLWDPTRRTELLRSKVYDICFLGYCSTPDRAAVVDHVLERYGHMHNAIMLERRPGAMDRFVMRREYFETMARSKICINLPGASACGRALRYYEIPYVGSCMLTMEFPARLLDPFEDRKHCMYFDGFRSFDERLQELYWNPDLRERLATAGHSHALTYHTVDARVEYMLGVIGG